MRQDKTLFTDFNMIDLPEAEIVELMVDSKGKCWINLNGKCLLRVQKIKVAIADFPNGDMYFGSKP
jgi:hypothetical protein